MSMLDQPRDLSPLKRLQNPQVLSDPSTLGTIGIEDYLLAPRPPKHVDRSRRHIGGNVMKNVLFRPPERPEAKHRK